MLWAAQEELTIVVAPRLMGGSPFHFTKEVRNEEFETRGGKTVAIKPLLESVLVRKCQALAC